MSLTSPWTPIRIKLPSFQGIGTLFWPRVRLNSFCPLLVAVWICLDLNLSLLVISEWMNVYWTSTMDARCLHRHHHLSFILLLLTCNAHTFQVFINVCCIILLKRRVIVWFLSFTRRPLKYVSFRRLNEKIILFNSVGWHREGVPNI